MKDFFPVRRCYVVLAVIIMAAAGFVYADRASAFFERRENMTFDTDTLVIRTAAGEEFTFTVELALEPDQHRQGLMNRPALAADAGMLFIFPYEIRPTFWMKDTLIPLDMIFIAKDGRINHIHPMARPLDETLITTDRDSLALLELQGGMTDRLGIKIGDQVVYKTFRNN